MTIVLHPGQLLTNVHGHVLTIIDVSRKGNVRVKDNSSWGETKYRLGSRKEVIGRIRMGEFDMI